jgi:hypothetical protein
VWKFLPISFNLKNVNIIQVIQIIIRFSLKDLNKILSGLVQELGWGQGKRLTEDHAILGRKWKRKEVPEEGSTPTEAHCLISMKCYHFLMMCIWASLSEILLFETKYIQTKVHSEVKTKDLDVYWCHLMRDKYKYTVIQQEKALPLSSVQCPQGVRRRKTCRRSTE